MLIEDCFLTKVFAALGTRIRLLTRVDAKMLIQNGPLAKAPRAIRTIERFVIGMDAQVLGQVRLLAKAFAALGAPVRPRIGVDAFVLQQRALLLEILAAGQALEQPQIGALRFHGGRRWRAGLVHAMAAGQEIRNRILLIHLIERGLGLFHAQAGQRFVEIVERRKAGRRQRHRLARVAVIVQFGLGSIKALLGACNGTEHNIYDEHITRVPRTCPHAHLSPD